LVLTKLCSSAKHHTTGLGFVKMALCKKAPNRDAILTYATQIVVSSRPQGDNFIIFTVIRAAKEKNVRRRNTIKSVLIMVSRLLVGYPQPLQVIFLVAARNQESQQGLMSARNGVWGKRNEKRKRDRGSPASELGHT